MKYFEKIALNALKARQLAKSFGLIPEAGTPWKGALRELRKGKTPTDLGVVPPKILDSAKTKGVEWGEDGHELGVMIARNIQNNHLKTFPPYKGEVGMGMLVNPESIVFSPTNPMLQVTKKNNAVWTPYKTLHTHPKALQKQINELGPEGYLTQDAVVEGQLNIAKNIGHKQLELQKYVESGADPAFAKLVQRNRSLNPAGTAEVDMLADMAKKNKWPSKSDVKNNLIRQSKSPEYLSEVNTIMNKQITRPSGLDLKTYESIGHSGNPVGGGRVPHNILEPASGQVSVTKLKPSSGKVHQDFRAKYGPKNAHEIDAAFASGNTDQLVAKYGPDIISDYEKVQQNAITFSPYTTYWKL